MKKISIIIILSLLIFGCGNKEDTKDIGTTEAEQNEINQSFKIGIFDENMAKLVKFKGDLLFGKSWTDKLGENLLVFSQKEIIKEENGDEPEPDRLTRKLYAVHYAKSKDVYKLIREVQDFTTDCGFENRAKIMKESVTITDLDKDDFAEITFAYRLGCTSELSPDVLKLIMLENSEKYAIRGDTRVQYRPDEFVGGATDIDSNFDNAPEVFLNHAKSIWKEQQSHVQNNTSNSENFNTVKGVDKIKNLILSGNEPFWTLDLKKEGISIKNMGVSIEFISYGEIYETSIDWNFSVQEADVKIDINIKKEHGYDGMSGHIYPFKTKVVLHIAGEKDKIFHGVGNYKNAKPLSPHPEKNGKFSNHNLTYKDVFITLDNIKFAIMDGDAKTLAQYIVFPLKVNTASGKSLEIKNTNDLEKQYNNIFSSKLKNKILKIDYNTVDDNSSGIFPKGGVVWLTEKTGKAKLFVINAK